MANLLIIDDDVQASTALAALLRREGHEVSCAPSAGEALSRLRQADPDLVLLDLTMPRVDGLDLFEALTDEPRFRNLRVAIYSGRDEPEALNAARRLGACDYIVKGGDWPQTYGRIKACLAGEEQMPSAPLA
jgi:DNA-binding response OmpR family regulator